MKKKKPHQHKEAKQRAEHPYPHSFRSSWALCDQGWKCQREQRPHSETAPQYPCTTSNIHPLCVCHPPPRRRHPNTVIPLILPPPPSPPFLPSYDHVSIRLSVVTRMSAEDAFDNNARYRCTSTLPSSSPSLSLTLVERRLFQVTATFAHLACNWKKKGTTSKHNQPCLSKRYFCVLFVSQQRPRVLVSCVLPVLSPYPSFTSFFFPQTLSAPQTAKEDKRKQMKPPCATPPPAPFYSYHLSAQPGNNHRGWGRGLGGEHSFSYLGSVADTTADIGIIGSTLRGDTIPLF